MQREEIRSLHKTNSSPLYKQETTQLYTCILRLWHSFQDASVYTLGREDTWFKIRVKGAIDVYCSSPTNSAVLRYISGVSTPIHIWPQVTIITHIMVGWVIVSQRFHLWAQWWEWPTFSLLVMSHVTTWSTLCWRPLGPAPRWHPPLAVYYLQLFWTPPVEPKKLLGWENPYNHTQINKVLKYLH